MFQINSSLFTTVAVGIFSIISFISCAPGNKKPVATPVGFDWQGHRGCRGLLPENSLEGFLHTLDFQQITTLELDVAISKDQQIIISHEPWFNPEICKFPNGDSIPKKSQEKNLIYEKTVAEIQSFDCGSSGNPRFPEQRKIHTVKPTLRAVVEAAKQKNPNIRWNIEIKTRPEWDGLRTPPVDEFAQILYAEIKSLGIENQCNVQSFDVRALQSFKKIAPDMPLALLIENIKGVNWNLQNLGFTPEIYSPYYIFVNRRLVKKCRKANMKIIPWTVNEVSAMRKLIHLGVDGIITDYPNRIQAVGGPNH